MLRHGRRLLSQGLSRAASDAAVDAALAERLVSGALASSSGTSAAGVQALMASNPRALQSLAKGFSSLAKRSGMAPAQLYKELHKVGGHL